MSWLHSEAKHMCVTNVKMNSRQLQSSSHSNIICTYRSSSGHRRAPQPGEAQVGEAAVVGGCASLLRAHGRGCISQYTVEGTLCGRAVNECNVCRYVF